MKNQFVCDKCGLSYTKNGYYSHIGNCKLNKDDVNNIIKKYTIDFNTIRDLSKEYNICKTNVSKILGDNIRTLSESSIIAHKKYPESFKHTDESKLKMREKRLKFMKENPEKTAWRLSNISYPEKLFLDALSKYELDKKYLIVREYSVFPYFIDFAFINEKLAVEIDGSQHLEEERKTRDDKKDKLLIENGWSILRVSEGEVKKNISYVIDKVNNILSSNIIIYEKVGVIKLPKLTEYISVERNEQGYSEKQILSSLKQRKVERPPYEFLIKEIKELGYCGVGRKYGVTDSAIRKWKKLYEK